MQQLPADWSLQFRFESVPVVKILNRLNEGVERYPGRSHLVAEALSGKTATDLYSLTIRTEDGMFIVDAEPTAVLHQIVEILFQKQN